MNSKAGYSYMSYKIPQAEGKTLVLQNRSSFKYIDVKHLPDIHSLSSHCAPVRKVDLEQGQTQTYLTIH